MTVGIFAITKLFAMLMASAVVPSRFGPSTLGMYIRILGLGLDIECCDCGVRDILDFETNECSVVVPRCGVLSANRESSVANHLEPSV